MFLFGINFALQLPYREIVKETIMPPLTNVMARKVHRKFDIVENNQVTKQEYYISEEIRYQTLSLLTQYLDPKNIIDQFHKIIKNAVPHDSIRYVNDELNISLSVGSASRNTVDYTLNHNNTRLGDLVLTRSCVFAVRELEVLEEYLTILVTPLKNAVLFEKTIESAFIDPLTGKNNRVAMEKYLMSTSMRH